VANEKSADLRRETTVDNTAFDLAEVLDLSLQGVHIRSREGNHCITCMKGGKWRQVKEGREFSMRKVERNREAYEA